MPTDEATATGRWGRAAGVHLGVVGLSFVLSVAIFSGGGLLPGEVIDCMACGVLTVHLAAAVLGVCIRQATVRSCLLLFTFAFFPAGLEGILRVRNNLHHRYQLPYDRFRDNLADPVPKSVSDLRFVPLEEHIRPDLMFRFDIAPADLDAVLQRLELKRVTPDQLLDPQDFFCHPYYLPFDGEFQLFQGTGRYDEVLTVKTNESHTHAVFRRESSSYYRDRQWENGNEVGRKMDRDALERLRARYEARR